MFLMIGLGKADGSVVVFQRAFWLGSRQNTQEVYGEGAMTEKKSAHSLCGCIIKLMSESTGSPSGSCFSRIYYTFSSDKKSKIGAEVKPNY